MKKANGLIWSVLAAAVILLAACTSLPPVEQETPAGIAGLWYITDADGWTPTTDGLNIPSMFFEDDYVAVYTGLNSLMAGYTADVAAQRLCFDTNGPMTRVSGTDHQMHFESALLTVLPQVVSFVLDEADGILELFDSDESLLLVLER